MAVQGLLNHRRGRATRGRVLAAIRRMRLLQIDTINVVARSPYFVLFSRIGNYESRWLDDLLKRGSILECWAHEACFAPAEDLVLHRSDYSMRAHHWAYKHAQRMHREHRAGMDKLLAHIREHGEVKTSDAQRRRQQGWGWKDENVGSVVRIGRTDDFAASGELSTRLRFCRNACWQRIRVKAAPSDPKQIRRQRCARSALLKRDGLRIISERRKKHKDADLRTFVDSGESAVRVDVRDAGSFPRLCTSRSSRIAETRAQKSRLRATYTTVVAVRSHRVGSRAVRRACSVSITRSRCYTPAPKRKYGYFVLPILRRGELIDRLDAKAHRALTGYSK